MGNNNFIYEELLDYCRWGWAEKLHETLESAQEPIDIFFNDNVLLRVAICDKDHPSMFIDIIKYYEDKIINHAANKLLKSHAVMKLIHTLEEDIDSTSSFSDEVQEVLSKYSSHTDGEDYTNELDDVKLVYDDHHVTTDSQEKSTQLTEDNLIMLSGDSPYTN